MYTRKAIGVFILGVAVLTILTIGLFPSRRVSDTSENHGRFRHFVAVRHQPGTPARQTIASPVKKDPYPNGIHIVMIFPLMKSEASKRQGYNINDSALLEKREQEFFDSLKDNSNQRIVTKIYLLNERPELLRRQLANDSSLDLQKIETVQSSDNPSYMEVFKFASEKLQNKLVFVLNADNSLGKGFEELNRTWWSTGPHHMYALTRHAPLRGCKLGPVGYCDPDGSYIGSHDGFLFYLKTKLPDAFLRQLDFVSNAYGSENVIIWAFRKILRYKVTNPCLRLFIHHNHCSNLRPRDIKRVRVNNNGRSGVIGYSW